MDDRTRKLLSLYFDGEVSVEERVEVEELLETSTEAKRYLESLSLLRRSLRYEEADSPDVTAPVMARISAERRTARARRVRLAAAFAAGSVAGAVFIGVTFDQPTPVASADIPTRILQAQTEVSSLSAGVRIVERGLHPDVPERIFEGQIVYESPETLLIDVNDLTEYPSEEWVPNHSRSVVSASEAWYTGVAACPIEALPSCTPDEPRSVATVDREPFPDRSPAPLDLIVPVTSFHLDFEPEFIGYRTVDGRQAIGLGVTAAQVDTLIDGLTSVGNWREVHPGDVVALWLDVGHLVPLAMTVTPADSADRRLWAIRNGYSDSADIPIFEVEWSGVFVNEAMPLRLPTRPQGLDATSAGFDDMTVPIDDLLAGVHLPEGFAEHRSGQVSTANGPTVWVSSWSNGRAWLKISWTTEWAGSHLFGDLGDLVRTESINNGTVYLDEKGERIAIHARHVDVLITGSLSTETLLGFAATLEIVAETVPSGWREAAVGTIDEAVAAIEGLIIPSAVDGFAEPAITVGEDVVALSYAGPGNRAFLLTQALDGSLSPPLEADVRGVSVRGLLGRYSPGRGELEWIENGIALSLSSKSLSLDELLEIAGTMVSP